MTKEAIDLVNVIEPGKIGVVVIGRNEGQRLIACLTSARAEADTIIYVDSGSTDNSVAEARLLGVDVVQLDMSRPFTAARARNAGFSALDQDDAIQFVQFIDGDCELEPNWLLSGLSFLSKHDDAAVVFGRLQERHPDYSIYNRICDIEWNVPVGKVAACGGIAMIRAAAFKSVGGFRSELIAGEEPELCVRLREKGWEIWRLEPDMARHDAAIVHFSQWWTRAVRGGYAYFEVWLLHRKSTFGIYSREVRRTVFWGGMLPALFVLASLVQPWLLLSATVYPIQVARIAMRRGVFARQSWIYALFMTLSKFAECQGIARFLRKRWGGEKIELIEYK